MKGSAVAYINVDGAASGPYPDMSATPGLHKVGMDAMKKIVYPVKGVSNSTMYDVWQSLSEGEVGVLGSGSDYTAFVHNGIPSVSHSQFPALCRTPF